MRDLKFGYIADGHILENPSINTSNPEETSAYTFIHKCNFYKLFWIFIIGSIFGCYMEQIQYYLLRGIWESRAGVIWGPFSEIYGCGAVIVFLLSYKIGNSSPLTIFCMSSLCGSTFEYCASLFQELVFGSVTWNYHNQPLNLGGRTSLKYAIYWGLLGLAFIKWIFPMVNKILENIRGKAALAFTLVLIVFMSLNLLSSAFAVNRWEERLQGEATNGYVDEFIDTHYGNDKMESIFPHMKFVDTSSKAA